MPNDQPASQIPNLSYIREKIAGVDEDIVRLLNARANLSLQVGEAKRVESQNRGDDPKESQVFVPGQEQLVFDRLGQVNQGPLPITALKAIYREVMSASIALQRPVGVGYLGPRGTFTHAAALKKFGEGVAYSPYPTIAAVFRALEAKEVTYAVVPAENSRAGSVQPTLDQLISSPLRIRGETYLPVEQCLLSNTTLASIRRIYSMPVAFEQSEKWLESNASHVERVNCDSTAQAAEQASRDPEAAAVASAICSEIYGLNIIARGIQDQRDNTTRFFILAPEVAPPSAADKSLLAFSVDHRQPGALCDALRCFKEHGVNLTNIASRPHGPRPWEYLFFVECSGHSQAPPLSRVLDDMKAYCPEILILGSFPDQRPIPSRGGM
ncbi:Prephenate dehydratase-domain-containing protein [Piptocephalis cylindrospora]|uniref:Bifunctional chorismate mutase/prephenate dehydratase n=1 Tax=Piptocephalis cylindrospora TaxID=1907219 RepID=A0A4P9Y4Q2_9FUNG|nr:Prephenate dehydratase-domain-containing protein [Piptocephalis cylindrospora]|eukprot:RKP13958.1 Prephenate dehydratase-domain-containing protein [Piptocephalis cylindrospora]